MCSADTNRGCRRRTLGISSSVCGSVVVVVVRSPIVVITHKANIFTEDSCLMNIADRARHKALGNNATLIEVCIALNATSNVLHRAGEQQPGTTQRRVFAHVLARVRRTVAGNGAYMSLFCRRVTRASEEDRSRGSGLVVVEKTLFSFLLLYSKSHTVWSAVDSGAYNMKVCDNHVREITERLESDIGAGKVECANRCKPGEAPNRGDLRINLKQR